MQNSASSFLQELRDEFKPQNLIPSLAIGSVLGVLKVIVLFSFTTLIFAGSLSRFALQGLGIILLGDVILVLGIAFLSRRPGLVASVQDNVIAVLALIVADVTLAVGNAPDEEIYATVLATMGLSSLVIGLSFLLLGRLKLASLARFIPYPVVGGFLGGTGWLLTVGSLGVMTGISITLAGNGDFLAPAMLLLWVPGVFVGLLLLFLTRRVSHFLVLPVTLALGVLIFHGLRMAYGISIPEAEAMGLLLGGVPQGSAWQPLLPGDFSLVHWDAIWPEAGHIATLVVVAVIGLLLNVSGIEVAIQADVEENREMTVAGFSTLLVGFLSGVAGYHALSLTALGYRTGAATRLLGVVITVFLLVALLFGGVMLQVFPLSVLGGLLLYLGLSFLVEWLWDARRSLQVGEYLLIWLIVVVIGAVGFLQGVGVGLAAAIILFVVNYSRQEVIKHAYSGAQIRSNVERPSAQRRLLADHSGSIHVMELTGFLFFGSAYKIMDDITARLKATDQAPLRYLILDFERVNGADSSALKLLPRVIHDLEAGGGRLLLSSVRERFLKQFAASGVKISAQGGPVLREDVDRALEWCEDQILNDLGMDSNRMRVSMAGALKDDVLIMNLIDKRGTERVLEDGEVLLQQDQSADGIYYVKDGRLRVSFFTEAGHTIRLREIGEGNWVGEVGYYLDQPASATVKAMGPCTVAFLSDETIKKLAQEDSETGRNFHLFMARLLAERLADSNRVIEALRD